MPPLKRESEGAHSPRRLAVMLIAFATVALTLAGLVARNDSWIYTVIGWLDPWSYVGFGYSYHEPGFGADDYKMARLPGSWRNFMCDAYSIR